MEINAEDLLRELEAVEGRANEVEDIVEEVKETARSSLTQVMGGVHAAWLATQGIVRATGGTIETVFRTVVGTTLGAISMLVPLLTAEAVTPGMQIQAAMGLASIGIAVSAMVAAELEQRELSDQLRGANMALHGIQSLIGVFNFWRVNYFGL